MRVVEIKQPGDATVLKLAQRSIPVPSADQVLIKVAAAGVNRPDIMQRQGLYPAPAGASDIPGLEVAGTIIELGANVGQFSLGDSVCALVTGGGYAEYCLVSATSILPIPTGYSFIEAASIPETFFTVWHNLFDHGKLKVGESLLVHGGTSGIGTSAIQLAKAFGVCVITTAGTPLKCDFCEQLGADLAINYHEQDFVAAVKDFTNQQGVNIILDMVGAAYFPRNLKCLAPEGRLVQIAIMTGAKTELDLWSVMAKRLTITGSTLRSRTDEVKAQIAQKLLTYVWPYLESRTIKPIIHSTFKLSDAAKAHQLMESSQHIGKIILEIT